MKVRTYQSLQAIVLALALGALFAPSALADPPSGHQAGSSAPVSENTIGLTGERSFSTSLRGLDPWMNNALRRSQPVATATGEHTALQAPAASATLGSFHWGDAAIGASLAALLGLLSVGGTIARRRRASLAH